MKLSLHGKILIKLWTIFKKGRIQVKDNNTSKFDKCSKLVITWELGSMPYPFSSKEFSISLSKGKSNLSFVGGCNSSKPQIPLATSKKLGIESILANLAP